MRLLKVSAKSNPNAVAGAFAAVVRERGTAEVCVIGAGAINQAIKAVAIARAYLHPEGVDLVCVPSFCELEIDGERRTGVRLVVEPRIPSLRPEAPAARDGASVTTPASTRPSVDVTPAPASALTPEVTLAVDGARSTDGADVTVPAECAGAQAASVSVNVTAVEIVLDEDVPARA